MEIQLRKILVLCLWGLNFSFTTWADVNIASNKLEGTSSEKFKKLATAQWREWNLKFGLQGETDIHLESLGSTHEFSGKSSGNVIALNPNLEKDDLLRTFRHELAHVFLSQKCSTQTNSDEFLIQEVFAQWITRDYVTLAVKQKDFPFKRSAINYLSQNEYSGDRNKLENAVARLLMVDGKESRYQDYFKNLFKICTKDRSKMSSFFKKINEILKLENLPNKKSVIDFVLVDGLSNKVIKKSGKTETQFPIGSTLKPFLLGTVKKLSQPIYSRSDQSWACPAVPSEGSNRNWEWQEALRKSCNGFFIDHKFNNTDWLDFINTSKNLGIGLVNEDIAPNILQLIGLLNGVKLSLTEMVSIYRYLGVATPYVIDALKETPITGTVSQFGEADWFRKNAIAIKTGSVRSAYGVPLESWMVAIGPSVGKRPSFIAVIHGAGVGTSKLSEELYRRLRGERLLREMAQVQILGLVSPDRIVFLCERGKLLEENALGNVVFLKNKQISGHEAKEDHRYSCPDGKLIAEFPNRKGQKISRKYFGEVLISSIESTRHKGRFTPNHREQKARQGSRFILHTSRENYLKEVIGSEFPRGRSEVLRVLSEMAWKNHQHSPHEGRPVCDTTHCQLFGHGGEIPPTLDKKLSKNIKNNIMSKSDLLEDRWHFFYLGGERKWQKKISKKLIESKLDMINIRKIELRDQDIIITNSKGTENIQCELVRNQLNLLSCPNTAIQDKDSWLFTGNGEGHGKGINLEKANAMAAEGKTAKQIADFFKVSK